MTDAEMKILCDRDKAMICAIIDGDYDSVIHLAEKSRVFYRDLKLRNSLETTTEKK